MLLCNTSKDRREVLEQTGGWYPNDGYDMKVTTGEDGAEKATFVSATPSRSSRSRVWSDSTNKGVVHLGGYLLTDLFSGDDRRLILPPCSLSLDLVLNDPSRFLLSTAPQPVDVALEVTGTWLTVPRIATRPGLVSRPLRWDYARVSLFPVVCQKGLSEFAATVQVGGPLPQRLSFMLVSAAAYDGDTRLSHLASSPHGLISAEFRLGSRVLPAHRYRTHWGTNMAQEMFLQTREALRHSLTRCQSSEDLLTYPLWGTQNFIFAVDASRDNSSGSDALGGVSDSGAIHLSASFENNTSQNLVFLVFVEHKRCLRIHPSSGAVSVD